MSRAKISSQIFSPIFLKRTIKFLSVRINTILILCFVIGDGNIFFHETSCFGDEGVILTARQACAVESAAKMNPTKKVYLFLLSHSNYSISTERIIKRLVSYENIFIKRIYMEEYVKNTPLEDWWQSGVLKSSRWPRSHMSDILRYLTLWKFGGIYLDLDVVITT